ncbi:unnamed protein product [Urochloa humidicola]
MALCAYLRRKGPISELSRASSASRGGAAAVAGFLGLAWEVVDRDGGDSTRRGTATRGRYIHSSRCS